MYYNAQGELLYVGKATSLKRRVGSYFNKQLEGRIRKLVSEIARIDYIETPTVIEALILEANKIKALSPKYNILSRDDKTFLYLAITNDEYPRPELIRGHDLKQQGEDRFLRVFGPYISSRSLKMALELVRKFIPWSTCEPDKKRPCFNAQIGKCPGVCTRAISKQDYRRYIRQLIDFFDGKKAKIEKQIEREMHKAAKELRFEDAAILRRRLFALQHIKDIALISKEDHKLPFSNERYEELINLDGRIEAYDISNISGTNAVGSMVVFENGRPAKSQYRKFKIKTVKGANDVAMMDEVIRRRLRRGELYPNAWPLPELMVIDGGHPQVNRVQRILTELGLDIPIVGLAKGPDRKQDAMVYNRKDRRLQRTATRGKELFQKARDEAHRFAVKYHRELRGKSMKPKKR